jgi:hypothetical protein
MSSTDYGFVSRRTPAGRTLYFGNGLIGAQPAAGSTVAVTIYETEGEDGNVITASINKGDKIYITTLSGAVQIVNYTCVNTSPANGGQDEESTEDIRSNSIKNLVSLGRLVSEVDYQNTDVVIPYSPFHSSPLPVLKRSDIKCNEIQLYSNLDFGGVLVPTRNEKLIVPRSTTNIPRGTIITSNGVNYSTLFNLTLDYTNGSGYYDYIMYDVTLTPNLQTTFNPSYNDIAIQNLNMYLDSTTGAAVFELTYTGTDTNASCKLEIMKSSQIYQMTNDTTNKLFTYSFNPYTLFPDGDIILNFIISSGSTQICIYSITVTFRKSLNDFMMSNMIDDPINNIATIYDIPVILTSYYNSIIKKDFELQVLQYMMSSLTFSNYKMITDFVNVKFSNTIGLLTNMQYNNITKSSVMSISQSSVPHGNIGDSYIVNGTEGGVWTGQKNNIAQCIDSTSQTWYFFNPIMDDMIYVADVDLKYIFTGSQWFLPEYNIPLQISIEVVKATDYLSSDSALTSLIQSNILSAFKSRFGSNISLYRSEIIAVVQETDGVGYCNLIKPESNIFFNFNLDDFSQSQLLEYTPEYIYFSISDISVKVLG